MPRWTTKVLLGAGAVALVAGAGVAYVISRDTTTPVEVADAVGRFREEGGTSVGSSTSAPEGRPVPAAGVYVYATEGTERVDLLGGATHDYPAETTLTIAHIECGLRQRWSPIVERWDEEELCATAAGLERHTLHTHHQFFGFDDDQDFACEPGYVTFPVDPAPGDSWTTDCQAGDTHLTGTGEVVGFEVREVAGRSVDTVHVRIEETASGADTGPSSDDYWLRRSDGLLIARESSVQTSSDSPVGTAAYEEHFVLRLTSVTPRT